MLRLTLNSRPCELPEGATAADAVSAAGIEGDGRGVAVALDGEVVPRAEWETTGLAEGAEVEVLQAVQGG